MRVWPAGSGVRGQLLRTNWAGPAERRTESQETIASREFLTLSLVSFLHRAQLLLRD